MVYTSYDYGAPITEGRQLTPNYTEEKRENYFLDAMTPLTKTVPATGPAVSNAALTTLTRRNPDDGTQFVLLRHKVTDATTGDSGTLDWPAPDGDYRVPVTVQGRDAKILVAGYDLGGQRLVLSTSEIMTHLAVGGRDIAVLYGDQGVQGTTIVRYASRPTVTVLDGRVSAAYANGDLRLSYVHDGLARVLISGGGRRPFLLMIGTPDTTGSFWRDGDTLVRGTSLLRSATVSGGVATLRADTTAPGPIEVFADATKINVNGSDTEVSRTPSGSVIGELPGPAAVRLPALTDWRAQTEAPESRTGFDDSSWTVADHTTTTAPMRPPTLPVLYSDDYGYHAGSVWYRATFTATGKESAVDLSAITGRGGNYLVWLNGQYLGSASGGTEWSSGSGRGIFAATGLKSGERAVLAVLVQNMGDNDDYSAQDSRFKQPRGLTSARITGSSGPIVWRIRGGNPSQDPVRGPLNTGGLYGELNGWHLPAYDDSAWPAAAATVQPGVTWLRTDVALDLPAGQDTSVALTFPGTPPAGYRLLIFVNGWQLGQYGGDVGPQTSFVLPNGILDTRGSNEIALAIVAASASGVPNPQLTLLGTARTG